MLENTESELLALQQSGEFAGFEELRDRLTDLSKLADTLHEKARTGIKDTQSLLSENNRLRNELSTIDRSIEEIEDQLEHVNIDLSTLPELEEQRSTLDDVITKLSALEGSVSEIERSIPEPLIDGWRSRIGQARSDIDRSRKEAQGFLDRVEVTMKRLSEEREKKLIIVRSLLERVQEIEAWLKQNRQEFETFVKTEPIVDQLLTRADELLRQVEEKLREIHELDVEQGKVDLQSIEAVDLHQLIQFVQLGLLEFRDQLGSDIARAESLMALTKTSASDDTSAFIDTSVELDENLDSEKVSFSFFF